MRISYCEPHGYHEMGQGEYKESSTEEVLRLVEKKIGYNPVWIMSGLGEKHW